MCIPMYFPWIFLQQSYVKQFWNDIDKSSYDDVISFFSMILTYI